MTEEYRARFQSYMFSADVAFAISLARDVGIFETMMKSTKPMTSGQIAKDKQLKERYVQELLGSLTCGRVISLEKSNTGENMYFLSDAGKEVLGTKGTLESSLIHNAIMTCYSSVKECVFEDGPTNVRYGDDLFHALDEMNKGRFKDIIEMILSKIPGLQEKLEQGISVLEFGCGYGRIISKMAERFPNSKFSATDVRTHLIEKMKSNHGHLSNISFSIFDICSTPDSVTEKYDLMFGINVIHDLPHPKKALEILKMYCQNPDGCLAFLDPCGKGSHEANTGDPAAAAYYGLSTFLCIPESYQQKDSVALGACSSRDNLKAIAEEAGFQVNAIKLDENEAFFVCKH